MRNAVITFLTLLCLTMLAQAKYLDDRVNYAQERFIVKIMRDVGDLEPAFDGHTVHVFDPTLTALNQKWGVIHVERLFVGPENDKISVQFDLAAYWRFWLGKPADAAQMEAILADYAADKLVDHVEPVGIHEIYYSPTDPWWSNQWYIRNQAGDHDIDAVEGWDIERGDSAAILGITDTGVLYTHPDLRANIWHNWAEVNGTNGVDNDGNGFVDDTVGYDFVSAAEYGYSCWSGEDCTGADADPKDFNGHGTHCAGIAAAVMNDGAGGVGIAGGGSGRSGARIMPLRIGWSASYLGQEAGFVGMDYAAQAFDYGRNKGVCAFNCSWGNDSTGGFGVATNAAIAAGIVICVAAGNSNDQVSEYLTLRTDCIAVAATDSFDHKASFSSYGTWVEVSAPGVRIYSTYSTHYTASYAYLQGTSMAAPCVTGEVGLLKSRNPSWTRTQIMPAIINNVDNINALNPSYVGKLGSGRINVNLALLSMGNVTVTVPNGGESWIVGNSQNITWTTNGISGNVKIELTRNYNPAGGSTWETVVASTGNTGTYPWTVTSPTTAAARVRISSATLSSVGDTSNANFAIASVSITVTVPNGGETWYTGENHSITWTSSGISGNVCLAINRNYSVGTWDTLAASVSNSGSWPWAVTGPATSVARIRVSSVTQPSILDVSNANFSVVQTSITVSSPNGGETWFTGESHNISWTSVGVAGNVKIELNRNYSGGLWEPLFAGTANDGSEPWIVTGPVTTVARVRVSSVNLPSTVDESDANFSIMAPAPTVVIHVQDTAIVLSWNATGAPFYDVYADSTLGGSYSLFVGSTADTFLTLSNSAVTNRLWFYRATSATP